MSQKQQSLMTFLNKYVRQYFLYKELPEGHYKKVRLRNLLHCVEDVTFKACKNKQRCLNDYIGQLTPENLPYDPVSGWPVLRLEDLVLKTLEKRLDGKIFDMLKVQLEKVTIVRVVERKDQDSTIKDLSVVHKYPSAGFHRIKAHLADSESRIHYVKAGADYKRHLQDIGEKHNQRGATDSSYVHQFSADPNIVVAMERVQKDTLNFLRTLKEILDQLLLLKVRHLRSPVPIALHLLGTDKDRLAPGPEQSKHSNRVLQYPGGPPVLHSFKEQIILEAPPAWPLASKYPKKLVSRGVDHCPGPGTLGSNIALLHPESRRGNKKIASTTSSLTSILTLDKYNRDDHCSGGSSSPLASSVFTGSKVFQDQNMADNFRKRWPPIWMSLAAMDQGTNIVDPQCPTREHMNQQPQVRAKKSLTDILVTRNQWADMRGASDKSVEETLWREDKERMRFFRVQYASLSHLQLAKPYPNHKRQMVQMLADSRLQRQKYVIFDCELSEWYKYLVSKVQETVGRQHDDINHLLEQVKFHFKLSPTSPRYAKAKLALITLSMPAHVITQIHVQRAIRFILCHVFQAPEGMLIGWLQSRGLPFILISSHAI